MIDKNTFMETVHLAAEAVRNAEKPLSEEELASYFKELDLSEKQHQMVIQFLQEQKNRKDNDEKTTEVELPKTAFFQMYLEDLKKIKSCTQQEEDELYKRLTAGDENALHKLSEQWLSRVLMLAKKCAVSTEDLPDMIQEGNMGVFLELEKLLGCGKEYDYVQLLSHAANSAMQKYLKDSDSAKEIAQSVLAKASLVYEAQKYLTEEFQRIPSMTELSQYTKIPIEELDEILRTIKK